MRRSRLQYDHAQRWREGSTWRDQPQEGARPRAQRRTHGHRRRRQRARRHFTGGSKASTFLGSVFVMERIPCIGCVSTRWLWSWWPVLSNTIMKTTLHLSTFASESNSISVCMSIQFYFTVCSVMGQCTPPSLRAPSS